MHNKEKSGLFLIQSVVPEDFRYSVDGNNYDPTAARVKKPQLLPCCSDSNQRNLSAVALQHHGDPAQHRTSATKG